LWAYFALHAAIVASYMATFSKAIVRYTGWRAPGRRTSAVFNAISIHR
jgi:hypothetical protein